MPCNLPTCMGVSIPWRRSSPLGLLLLAAAVVAAALLACDASAARKPTAVQLVTRDAIVATGRGFELELRCPGSARSCEGSVTVRELRPVAQRASATPTRKRRTRALARGEATLEGGIATAVRLELTKKAFKRVRRRGPLVARVVMNGRDATGRRVQLRRNVRIGVPARAKPSLLLGVAGDRIQGAPDRTADVIRGLGLQAVRISLLWQPGQATLSAAQAATVAGVVSSARDLRVVLTARSRAGSDAPTSASDREAYCSFVGDIAARFPEIADFGIWLEPNKQQFWAPQYGANGASVAPRDYAALLARCWDVLHGIRADVNVIGPSTASKGNDRPDARSNISHSPGSFIRLMGKAYRASGRSAPLFDTVGHHPYGENSAERPWFKHTRSSTLGFGDWDGLLQALHDAFGGTGQLTPDAEGGPQVWYTESGFQTVPDAPKAALYTGAENDARALRDLVAAGDANTGAQHGPDQATQLRDAIQLAYCQPYVTGLFDFLLYDESNLGRWQSGVFWADETPKRSAAPYAEAVASANQRTINCSKLKNGPVERAFIPKSKVEITRIGWSRSTRFNHKHDLWRVHLQLDEPASYVATIVPVRRRGTSARAAGPAERVVKGTLRKGFYQWVTFPRERLAPGQYRIELTVASTLSAQRTATLDGPVFEVVPRRSRSRAG